MLVLIVFVPTEDDYLLKGIAAKNVDGKDTHISPGSHAERSGFDSQSGVSCLDSSVPAHSASLLCFSITRQSVYGCLFLHLSPLMNSPLVRGRLHLPPLQSGTLQTLAGLAASSPY